MKDVLEEHKAIKYLEYHLCVCGFLQLCREGCLKNENARATMLKNTMSGHRFSLRLRSLRCHSAIDEHSISTYIHGFEIKHAMVIYLPKKAFGIVFLRFRGTSDLETTV